MSTRRFPASPSISRTRSLDETPPRTAPAMARCIRSVESGNVGTVLRLRGKHRCESRHSSVAPHERPSSALRSSMNSSRLACVYLCGRLPTIELIQAPRAAGAVLVQWNGDNRLRTRFNIRIGAPVIPATSGAAGRPYRTRISFSESPVVLISDKGTL